MFSYIRFNNHIILISSNNWHKKKFWKPFFCEYLTFFEFERKKVGLYAIIKQLFQNKDKIIFKFVFDLIGKKFLPKHTVLLLIVTIIHINLKFKDEKIVYFFWDPAPEKKSLNPLGPFIFHSTVHLKKPHYPILSYILFFQGCWPFSTRSTT